MLFAGANVDWGPQMGGVQLPNEMQVNELGQLLPSTIFPALFRYPAPFFLDLVDLPSFFRNSSLLPLPLLHLRSLLPATRLSLVFVT